MYADSGGLPELVGDFGVAIDDNKDIYFANGNFPLDFNVVKEKYELFKYKYENNLFIKENKIKYIDTLKNYIKIITYNDNI